MANEFKKNNQVHGGQTGQAQKHGQERQEKVENKQQGKWEQKGASSAQEQKHPRDSQSTIHKK